MFAKIQKILQKSHSAQSLNQGFIKVEFNDLQHAKDFVVELLKIGFGNRNMPDAPKKIEPKLADLENPQDRFIIELTEDEWNALQQDEQLLPEEKQPKISPSQTLATQGFFAEQTQSSSRIAYEAYERKVEEMLKGIDLDRLTALIKTSIKQIAPAKNKDLILLVGRTGAGKSTTLNYLMGSKMVLQKRGVRSRLEVAQGETVYAKIGHGESETLHPLAVPMSNTSSLAYCDCPGFSDNRTREEKLCSSVGLPMAIKYANAIRGVLVVIEYADLTAARGEGFVSLAKTLGTLLNRTKLLGANEAQTKIFDNWLFVFTKVPKGDEIADILITIEDEKAILSDKLEKLKKENEQLVQDLVKLLSISKDILISSDKEQRNIIIKKATETTNQETTKKAQQLTERLDNNEAEYQDLVIKLGIYQSILMHKENVFIIRGDEADDKLKILNKLQALQKSPSIPKEYFVLDDNRSGEWNVLDKIIQKIARDGTQLLNEQIRYPAELATLKKYKKLVEKQRAEQEQILQKLKSSKFSQGDLQKLCKEIFTMSEELTNQLGKTLEQKQIEKKKLEKELKELDTAQRTRYRHRNLDPVSFKMNAKKIRPVGIGIGAILALVSFPILLPVGLIRLTSMGLENVLEKAGIYISPTRTVDEELISPVMDAYSVSFFKMLGLLTEISHRFQYNDLPFIYITRKCDPSYFYSEIDITSDEDGAMDPSDFYNEIGIASDEDDANPYSKLGFDLRHEVTNPGQGKYEISYKDRHGRHGYTGELTIWIELFVEKRMHPDFKPRIEIIKKDLEVLELSLSDYLKNDLERLTQTLAEEKKLLEDISEEKKLQSKLFEILEKRLSQHQKRMEILRGCILGYQAYVQEGRRELARQKPRYTMLAQLAEVIGVNQFVKTFLDDCASYFKQENTAQLSTVWGRKQTPDQQPDYEVHEAKVEGTSLGAFFKLRDKPHNFGWLGKLGYKSLSPVESPELALFSRVRRGSALESLLEKIATDLYEYLSDGQYLVPKTRLAELPIENKFTKTHPLTKSLLEEINKDRRQKIDEGIYVMSKRVENYQDLAKLSGCILGENLFNFEQCLTQGKLPEQVMIENRKIPLKGVLEILAVSRLLADTDVLGGSAKNTGFLIERNAEGQPIAVRAVKVDPGFAFNFTGVENLFYQSFNIAAPQDNLLKQDKRHLQYGNQAKPLLWNNLTEIQQKQFICALDFGLRILRDNDAMFRKFVTRKEFEKTPKQRELPKVEQYLKGLQENLKLQEEAYKQELDELKKLSQESCFILSNY